MGMETSWGPKSGWAQEREQERRTENASRPCARSISLEAAVGVVEVNAISQRGGGTDTQPGHSLAGPLGAKKKVGSLGRAEVGMSCPRPGRIPRMAFL
jgi:hypothetical protein